MKKRILFNRCNRNESSESPNQILNRQLIYTRFVVLAANLKRVPGPGEIRRDRELMAGIGPEQPWKSISHLAKKALEYGTIEAEWYDDYIHQVYRQFCESPSSQAKTFDHRDIEAWKVFEIFFYRQFEPDSRFRIIEIHGVHRPEVTAIDFQKKLVATIRFRRILKKHVVRNPKNENIVFACRTNDWFRCPYDYLEIR